MIQETKICVHCGGEFQIHHVAQRQKKYCGYMCANHKTLSTQKAKRRKLDGKSLIKKTFPELLLKDA